MGKYNGAVLTTAGQQVISSAIAGSQTVQWTAIKTSSAVIPSGTNLEALTSLSDIEQSNDITSAQVYGETVIQVSGRISNLNIETAYLVQAIGLYGKIVGGQETLIAVSTAVTPDQVPVYDEDSPAAFIYNVQITVSNANQVTMTVNDAGTATVADLERVETTLINAINALGSTDASNGNLGYLRIETTDATTLAQLDAYVQSNLLYNKPYVVWVNSTLFGLLCPNASYSTYAIGLMLKDSYLQYMLSTSQGGNYPTVFSGIFYGASASTPVQCSQVISDGGYGDISNTKITTITASTASYPTISTNDSLKVAFGKINKFFADIGQEFTGSDSIHQGKKGLVPAPPIMGGRYDTGVLNNGGGWSPVYSDKQILMQYGDDESLASAGIVKGIVSDLNGALSYINGVTTDAEYTILQKNGTGSDNNSIMTSQAHNTLKLYWGQNEQNAPASSSLHTILSARYGAYGQQYAFYANKCYFRGWSESGGFSAWTYVPTMVDASFTGTTSAQGNLQILGNGSVKVICATSGNKICIPFLSGGHWFVKVFDTSMNLQANTSVTVNFTYFL